MLKPKLSSKLAVLLIATTSIGANAEITQDARNRCFNDNAADKTVTFVFDNNLWNVDDVTSVNVCGSFNSWKVKDAYLMTYDSTADAWTLTLPYSDVKIPGNSGQPEFKFVTNGGDWQSGEGKSFIPDGYVFMTSDKNNIVVFDSDDFDIIKANSEIAGKIKSLDEFDLDTPEGRAAISNFRLVPGTRALYRCYHPYKWSRPNMETEPVRIDLVQKLSAEKGINSDICLSGDESGKLTSYTVNGVVYQEAIPDYYKTIIENNRVLNVGTANGSTPSYNYVYYTPTSSKFGQWIKETVDFIISDESLAPYSIHCRLGTDRTGVFCGVLAALCGASWPEIAADYQSTNQMGILEFRDYHLLQHSFQTLLGFDDINQVDNLGEALAQYFIGKGFLSQADIDALVAKIGDNGDSGISESLADDSSAAPTFYNLQGIIVNEPSNGLFVKRQGNSAKLVFIK